MGFLSKAAKGLKKAVKKVAKQVKKTASKVWSAARQLPGIKQIQHAGSKVLGAVGKVMNKIGPLGMIAASFVLGPLAAGLWSSFGALGVSLSAAGNSMLAQAAGSVINGVVQGVAWTGGTLGAVGDAITQGASTLVKQGFSAGADEFTKHMASALSGDAGAAAVRKSVTQAAVDSVASKVTQETINQQLSANPEFIKMGGQKMAQEVSVDAAIKQGIAEQSMANAVKSGYGEYTMEEAQAAARKAMMEGSGSIGTVSQAELQKLASAKVTENLAAPSLMSQVKDGIKKAGQAFLDNAASSDETGTQMRQAYIPSITSAKTSGNVFGGSQGSAGFSLLSGVQGLEDSVRNSTQLVTRGFS